MKRSVSIRRGAWTWLLRAITLAVFVVGCNGILGIETTRVDRATATYGSGYEGCRLGDCDDCLSDEHRCLCRGLTSKCKSNLPGLGGGDVDAGYDPAVCSDILSASGSQRDECSACVCENCESPLAECLSSSGCAAVFSCITQFACNPYPGVANSCYADRYCKDVIDQVGGVDGLSYNQMLSVWGCTAQAECPCGIEAPEDNCTADGGCLSCASCYERCLCEGGTADSCESTCQGAVACTAADGCTHCGDCVQKCVCEGGDQTSCVEECAASGICIPGEDCTGCPTQGVTCLCNGGDSDTCFQQATAVTCSDYFGDADQCNQCACDSCAQQVIACLETDGCATLAQCLRVTGCEGQDCDQDVNCAAQLDVGGGVDGDAFRYAQALQACRVEKDCPCDGSDASDLPKTCATRQCPAYDGDLDDDSSPVLGACCFPYNNQLYCGLATGAVLHTNCEPLGQNGVVNAECPEFETQDGFPYFGTPLPGCCRENNTCGFMDQVTGLGCLPTRSVDGIATTPRNCTFQN